MRTPFQRDRDRIVHSKPFRRLKGKTQVFIDPEGDHYRTRMTHTLETTAISRVVARALRLNEDLMEAIGLGHDMGHTPFGHAGEEALDEALQERFGRRFRHNEQSLRIARSLNLTYEVCDGILTHTGEREPETLEGKIVRLVDRVAYINHDIDDAVRYGLLATTIFRARRSRSSARPARNGSTGSCTTSSRRRTASTTSASRPEVGEAMLSLRAFMFERVYLGPQAAPEHEKAHEVVRAIFDHLVERGDDVDEVVDYIAGMTDRFALDLRRLALSAGERALDLGDVGRRIDRAVERRAPARARPRRRRFACRPASAGPQCLRRFASIVGFPADAMRSAADDELAREDVLDHAPPEGKRAGSGRDGIAELVTIPSSSAKRPEARQAP